MNDLDELKIVDPDAWLSKIKEQEKQQRLTQVDEVVKAKLGKGLEELKSILPYEEYKKLEENPVIDLSEVSKYLPKEPKKEEGQEEPKKEEGQEESKKEAGQEEPKKDEKPQDIPKTITKIPEDKTTPKKESIIDNYSGVSF